MYFDQGNIYDFMRFFRSKGFLKFMFFEIFMTFMRFFEIFWDSWGSNGVIVAIMILIGSQFLQYLKCYLFLSR